MRKLDSLVVVDCEATCWRDDSLPKHMLPGREKSEIIEVGVCLLDLQTLEIGDSRSIFVKPVEEPILSDFCRELTGITQEQVDSGVDFAEACRILRKEYDTKNRSWASYGAYDANIFQRECSRKNVSYPFGKFHINVKADVEVILDKTVSMDEALKEFGLTLEGRHHSGKDDAWNIAKIYRLIIERNRKFLKTV